MLAHDTGLHHGVFQQADGVRRQRWGAGAAEPEQFQCLVDLRRQGVAFQAESWQQVGKVSAFDIQQFKQQVFDFDVVMAPLQAALRGALQRVFALAVEACDQAAKLHQTISAWRR
ncbi:hypothetical protein ALP64_200456 [Pseudomonas syringae pv. actinidiae]|nr:hypothetical protein ALP64_200456 [Pseudomonas syringae pv. actinidiae]